MVVARVDTILGSYESSVNLFNLMKYSFHINALQTQPSNLCTIHLERVDEMSSSPSEVMTQVLADHEVPENKQMLLFTHIRLAHSFANFKLRTNCILARLQAISVLGRYC